MVVHAGEQLVADAAVDVLSRLTYCGGVICWLSTPIESRSIWGSMRRQGEGETNVVVDEVADAAVDAAVDADVDTNRSTAGLIGDWFTTAFLAGEPNGDSRDLFAFLPV